MSVEFSDTNWASILHALPRAEKPFWKREKKDYRNESLERTGMKV